VGTVLYEIVGLSASITFSQRYRARLLDDIHIHRYSSRWYRWSGSQENRGQSGLRKVEHQERGRPGKSGARGGCSH